MLGRFLSFTAHSTDPIAFIHENILNSNGGRETKFAGSLFPPRFRNYTHRFIEKIPSIDSPRDESKILSKD